MLTFLKFRKLRKSVGFGKAVVLMEKQLSTRFFNSLKSEDWAQICEQAKIEKNNELKERTCYLAIGTIKNYKDKHRLYKIGINLEINSLRGLREASFHVKFDEYLRFRRLREIAKTVEGLSAKMRVQTARTKREIFFNGLCIKILWLLEKALYKETTFRKITEFSFWFHYWGYYNNRSNYYFAGFKEEVLQELLRMKINCRTWNILRDKSEFLSWRLCKLFYRKMIETAVNIPDYLLVLECTSFKKEVFRKRILKKMFEKAESFYDWYLVFEELKFSGKNSPRYELEREAFRNMYDMMSKVEHWKKVEWLYSVEEEDREKLTQKAKALGLTREEPNISLWYIFVEVYKSSARSLVNDKATA